MLMVVFGAGASYDSFPSQPPSGGKKGVEGERPPLAAHLFAHKQSFAGIANQFKHCQPIISRLRHLPEGSSVERELETLRRESVSNYRRHAQLAAVRYYLQEVVRISEVHWETVHRGITNFLTLLDDIEGWRQHNNGAVCLVTFNYDTMVESALWTVGVKITSMQDYITHDYKLIKLHGSVNWGRAVGGVPYGKLETSMSSMLLALRLIESAHLLQPRNDFRIVTSTPTAHSEDYPLIPAVAIPTIEKQEYECPTAHVKELDAFLPKVSKILVIGWRGAENHFLRKLTTFMKQPVKVMIVSGSKEDAAETVSNLSKAGLKVDGPYQKETHGFTTATLERKVQDFLRS